MHIMELLWFHPDVPKNEMVGAQDKDGYNCLNDACYYGHLPLIEFFFNHWPKNENESASYSRSEVQKSLKVATGGTHFYGCE